MKANTNLKGLQNFEHEAVTIFSTIRQLDKHYGANYLIQLLIGDSSFPLKKIQHAALETFGSLKHMTNERLRNFVNYLLEIDYLAIANPAYGTLKLTDKGEEFLAEPVPLLLETKTLKTSRYEQLIIIELRQLRSTLSKELNKPAFRIFTDFTLKKLVKDKPISIAELEHIAGLSDIIIENHGDKFLDAIALAERKRTEEENRKEQKKIASPSHQKVKELFLSGYFPKEIAEMRAVKESTILQTLIRLHEHGQIDFKDWIEQTLDKETLNKGVAYFKESMDQKLKLAHEKLEMPYDTLRLCRVYAAEVAPIPQTS